MTAPRPAARPGGLPDLTRWNRAGLSRFAYVDGDAAVWLEELRLALFGLYARGEDADLRRPEFWRDISLRPPEDWPDKAAAEALAAAASWQALAPRLPPQQETRGRRTERLLGQYQRPAGDPGWEIMRAFARAAHVLLGYLDAYANEGYLRTATQWDNLRRLAAMVNYQPTPPASASTTVGLLLAPDAGAVAIDAGLAFRHTPPAGAPLVFETLEPVACHPDLNAARVSGWNVNATPLDAARPILWNAPARADLAPGDLAVLAAGDRGVAATMTSVLRDAAAGRAEIAFAETLPAGLPTAEARLWTEPDGVRLGLAASGSGRVVVELPPNVTASLGAVVQIENAQLVVREVRGRQIVVETAAALAGEVSFAALVPFAAMSGAVVTGTAIEKMYFPRGGGVAEVASQAFDVAEGLKGHRFAAGGAATGFALTGAVEKIKARVVAEVGAVTPGRPTGSGRMVRFEGRPPKGLAEGDWFVARARGDDGLRALRVTGLRQAAGSYTVAFDAEIPGAPETTEFHGPMRRALTAAGFDVSPAFANAGGVADLAGLAPAARLLLKPGRQVIVARGAAAALAAITGVEDLAGGVARIAFAPTDAGAGWPAGETVFHLNTVRIGHGETKPPKTLGSGDGERPAQAFDFAVRDVSHVASTRSESGVAPDMDVTVDGERWDYRDFIDASAEGARAWSSTLTEAGTLRIHFRRRLPTGIDNVAVRRHRVGAGLAGTGAPPGAFAKPARKHRYVQAAVQPFATAGGADREPVERLRRSAPARLAASGRAVSLRDFERLAGRNALLWRARAEAVPAPGAAPVVRMIVAPAGGGPLTAELAADLSAAIGAMAAPGVRLAFEGHKTLPLHVAASVRADLRAVDRSELKRAAEEALARDFGLQARDFGQAAHVAEALATLERVPGVVTAVIRSLDLGPGYDDRLRPLDPGLPAPANVAIRDGAVAAIFPRGDQIAHVVGPAAVAVLVEDLA